MEMIIRGSEYQDFLTCRKKWYHGWVEKITPKRPDNKLFFGTVFHKWLEEYYNSDCEKLMADMMTSVYINEQDTSGMEQTELDDMMNLIKAVATYYDETYRENDSRWTILGTEVEFIVKLNDDLYYTGTIDLIYEVDGKIRFADHKTTTQLSIYEEKAKMDRQISRYWWVLKMMTLGTALIKAPNGEWTTWFDIKDKEIDGFDYNLIAKDAPKEPRQLKAKKGQLVGELSKDKSQKTTFHKYYAKIKELGLDPHDYIDILNELKNKPNQFLKRINVLRNDSELESAMWEFSYACSDIEVAKDLLTTGMAPVEAVTYRNIGSHCEHMCQFKSLCQTAIEGGNVSLVRNLGYVENKER